VTAPPWASELAAAFWATAGGEEPFPRNLRRPIARGLPLGVVVMPRLRLLDINDWFSRNRLTAPCHSADRSLRACLVARADFGYVFLDGEDAEDEQRMSLAHEVAHFLRHYRQPRRKAALRLGEQVLEVFDGGRPPTLSEVFHSLVAGVAVGYHVHLMGRDANDEVNDAGVAAAELEADRLGYELLAPAAAVSLQVGAVRGVPDRDTTAAVLRGYFGLPATHAPLYAADLVPALSEDPLLRRLGLMR
jgi:hypothetical protein